MVKGKSKGGSRVVSMNPDNMANAGLADDFDGLITKVRFKPWDYDGKIDHHILAVAVTIKPDEDSGLEEFTQNYSAGDLEHFAPSMDGEEPVDLDEGEGEDLEGIYAIAVGKREQLNNNSNWAHFLRALQDLGHTDFPADVSGLEGLYGHFNRVPQKKRSGIAVETEDSSRQRTILVLTELKDAPKGAKGGAKAKGDAKGAKAGGKKKGSDDLAETVYSLIVDALNEADDNTLSVRKATQIVTKQVDASDKAKVIKMFGDEDFLGGSDEFDYDSDEETLTIS